VLLGNIGSPRANLAGERGRAFLHHTGPPARTVFAMKKAFDTVFLTAPDLISEDRKRMPRVSRAFLWIVRSYFEFGETHSDLDPPPNYVPAAMRVGGLFLGRASGVQSLGNERNPPVRKRPHSYATIPGPVLQLSYPPRRRSAAPASASFGSA